MTAWLVIGLVSAALVALTTLNRRRDVPAVVFQKIEDFYTSQNSWLLAFELDCQPYQYLSISIARQLIELKALIQSIPLDPLRDNAPDEVKFSYSLTSQLFLVNLQREYDLLIDYHSQLH